MPGPNDRELIEHNKAAAWNQYHLIMECGAMSAANKVGYLMCAVSLDNVFRTESIVELADLQAHFTIVVNEAYYGPLHRFDKPLKES